MIGYGYQTAASTDAGNFLVTSGVTLYQGHAYVWVPGTNALVKVAKATDMSSYESAIWVPGVGTVPLATTMVGTGTNKTAMIRPTVWMENDQGYPVTGLMVGMLARLTTGEHVGANHSDLSTACIAGKIMAFDAVTNRVLVDFARKAV
jgi:hypothetical protein